MKTNPVTISNRQYWFLVILVVAAYGHFVYVHLVILAAGRDAWISLAMACPFICLMLYLQNKAFAHNPKTSLVDQALIAFGRWGGGCITSVYIAYFLFVSALIVNELSSFLGLIYPQTPAPVLIAIVTFLLAWVTRAGVEVLGRMAEMVLPLLICIGLFSSIMTMGDKQATLLLPFLTHSLSSLWHGTILYLTMIAELGIMGMMAKYVKDPQALPRQSIIAGGVITLMFIGPTLGPIMLFGERFAQILAYPTYKEIQYIRISTVFERLDVLAIILWMFGAFFRLAICGAAVSHAFSEWLRPKTSTLYAIPSAILIYGIASTLIPSSRETTHYFLYTAYPIIGLSVGFALPVITGFIAHSRQGNQRPTKQAKKKKSAA